MFSQQGECVFVDAWASGLTNFPLKMQNVTSLLEAAVVYEIFSHPGDTVRLCTIAKFPWKHIQWQNI